MSQRAADWAKEQRAGRAKPVLMALAVLANVLGHCYASLAYLAYVCEISESGVRRMIKELVARKLITVERRFDDDGACRSSGYQLAIDPPVTLTGDPSMVTGHPFAVTGAPVPKVTGGGCHRDRATTTKPVLY